MNDSDPDGAPEENVCPACGTRLAGQEPECCPACGLRLLDPRPLTVPVFPEAEESPGSSRFGAALLFLTTAVVGYFLGFTFALGGIERAKYIHPPVSEFDHLNCAPVHVFNTLRVLLAASVPVLLLYRQDIRRRRRSARIALAMLEVLGTLMLVMLILEAWGGLTHI